MLGIYVAWQDYKEFVNQFERYDYSRVMTHDSWLLTESVQKQRVDEDYQDGLGVVNQYQRQDDSGVMNHDSRLLTKQF